MRILIHFSSVYFNARTLKNVRPCTTDCSVHNTGDNLSASTQLIKVRVKDKLEYSGISEPLKRYQILDRRGLRTKRTLATTCLHRADSVSAAL